MPDRITSQADMPLGDHGDAPITAKRKSVMDRINVGRMSPGADHHDDTAYAEMEHIDIEHQPSAKQHHHHHHHEEWHRHQESVQGGGFLSSARRMLGLGPSGSASSTGGRASITSRFDPEDGFHDDDGLHGHKAHHHEHHRGYHAHGPHSPTRQLAAGEDAYLANKQAVKAMVGARLEGMHTGGKKLLPIAKNFGKIKEEMEAEVAIAAEEAAAAAMMLPPSRNLHDWFNVGLRLRRDARDKPLQKGDARINVGDMIMDGNRPLPEGYEIAAWSSPLIPLIRHKNTGIVMWPIRFDLLPLYDYIEGIRPNQDIRGMTTVFHYTSAGGFSRLVAPPEEAYEETWEFAEEIWDRLEDDFERHSIPDVKGAPEYSLPLVAAEPMSFKKREEVARAVFRTEEEDTGPGRVGHCVAFRVPTDHCLAAFGDFCENTIIILAPGKDDQAVLEEMGGPDGRGRKQKLMAWGQRAILKVRSGKEKESAVADKVKGLDLLEGLIDRETMTIIPPAIAEKARKTTRQATAAFMAEVFAEEARRTSKASRHSSKGSREGSKTRHENHEHDEEEDALRLQIEKLQQDKALLEKKVRHAEKHKKMAEEGMDCSLIAADRQRLEKLQRNLQNTNKKIFKAEEELNKLLEEDLIDEAGRSKSPRSGSPRSPTSGPASVYDGGEPESPGAGSSRGMLQGFASAAASAAAKKRKKKRKALPKPKNASEFLDETNEDTGEYRFEYHDMEGDIFREVFGGSTEGVRRWLEKGGDANDYHPSTGWTPLLMATSQGDPGLVELLLDYKAELSQTSRDLGWTPIHIAVRKNSMDVLRLILERHPSSVHEKTKDGSTALLVTVESGAPRVRDEMVRILLESSSEPNTARKDGWTALAVAVARNYRTAIKLLIQHRGSIFDDCPDTKPLVTVWQAAARHPGLQAMIKSKLNSRDIHMIEKRWPGALSKLDGGNKEKASKSRESRGGD